MVEKENLIVQEVKLGNKKAEEKLYKKYSSYLKKYLKYKFITDDNDIDDNVSEILIKIFEKIPQYNENKSNFKTWVITIAKNHIIDKSRKPKINCISINYSSTNTSNFTNFSKSENISLTSSLSCFSYNDNSTYENSDTLNFISNSIGLEDFHLLNMKYSEGYDYNEMGKEMGVSSSTISNRVNYVKGKIKKGV